MFQLILVLMSLFIGQAALAEDLGDLTSAVCNEVTNTYSSAAKGSDRPLSEYGVIVERADCKNFEFHVLDSTYKKYGSRNVLTSLEVTFQSAEIGCSLTASRSVQVELDSLDQPSLVIGDWQVWLEDSPEQACVVLGSAEIESFQFDQDKEKLTLMADRRLYPSIYIPEYTELGEPDNGTAGAHATLYALKDDKEFYGFVVEYWYANSEGPWSSRYILKYNAQGKLLGHLIESSGGDFCEYPHWSQDDTPDECR